MFHLTPRSPLKPPVNSTVLRRHTLASLANNRLNHILLLCHVVACYLMQNVRLLPLPKRSSRAGCEEL